MGSPCTVCSPSFLCGVSSVHSYLCVWTPAFLTTPPEATSAQRLGSYLKGLTQAPKFPSVKDCFSLTGTLGMRERKPTLVSITRNLQNPKPNTLPPSIRTRISGSQWRLPPSPPPRPHPWGSVGTIQMVLVMAEGGQWGEAIPYWPRVFPGALDGTHSTAHQAESTVGT